MPNEGETTEANGDLIIAPPLYPEEDPQGKAEDEEENEEEKDDQEEEDEEDGDVNVIPISLPVAVPEKLAGCFESGKKLLSVFE